MDATKGAQGGHRSGRRQGRGLTWPTRALTDPRALAEIGKLTDMRRRLLFLVGALVVFRIGTLIPVPGIDPDAVARIFDQHNAASWGC